MLKFHQDGTFRIMQITDLHEGPDPSQDTLDLVGSALDREKPDLVIFTGDQLKGMSSKFKDRPDVTRQVIHGVVHPLEVRGVPFMVTFGNHDDHCGLTNRQQYEIYAGHENMLRGNVRSEDDVGTADIPIYSSDGKRKVFNLYLFDSHGNTGTNGGYDPVSEEQLAWYESERDRLREEAALRGGAPVELKPLSVVRPAVGRDGALCFDGHLSENVVVFRNGDMLEDKGGEIGAGFLTEPVALGFIPRELLFADRIVAAVFSRVSMGVEKIEIEDLPLAVGGVNRNIGGPNVVFAAHVAAQHVFMLGVDFILLQVGKAAVVVVVSEGHHKGHTPHLERVHDAVDDLPGDVRPVLEFGAHPLELVAREDDKVRLFTVESIADKVERVLRGVGTFVEVRDLHDPECSVLVKFQHGSASGS